VLRLPKQQATKHLAASLDAYESSRISFAEIGAIVKGGVNHFRCAAARGVRKRVINRVHRARQTRDASMFQERRRKTTEVSLRQV
jgi:hypothetical protein